MIYRVSVTETRTTEFFVQADSEEAAKWDANILGEEVENRDWDDIETDIWVQKSVDTEKLPRHARIWSGGPEGDWIGPQDLVDA